jgi:hypothetical protein
VIKYEIVLAYTVPAAAPSSELIAEGAMSGMSTADDYSVGETLRLKSSADGLPVLWHTSNYKKWVAKCACGDPAYLRRIPTSFMVPCLGACDILGVPGCAVSDRGAACVWATDASQPKEVTSINATEVARAFRLGCC